MQRVFHFILSHAIWAATCASALVFQTVEMLHLPANYYLLAFVFFATLCSYNFHFVLGSIAGFQKISLGAFYKPGTFFMLAGATGMLLLFPGTNISFTNIAIAFLLTFLYSVPLLPFKQLAFTRKAGFLKTTLLAFTWMFVTVYLPISPYNTTGFSTLEILIMVKRFMFMLMLCILFDNRDAAVDEIRGMHSLATDLSPATMKWLIYCLFVLLFIINYILGIYGLSLKHRIALQLTAIATLIVYFFSTKKQGYFFYYFVVDGLMFLSALLVTIASI